MQQSAEEEKIDTGVDKEYGDPDVDGEPGSPGDDGDRPLSAPPDYDTVFTMPDFDNVPPPAVYREPVLEGQRDTDGNQQLSDPALLYADFVPSCLQPGSAIHEAEFEKFAEIVALANVWLSKNPHLRVMRCETVDRKVTSSGEPESEATTHLQSSHGTTCYVRALRLWLNPGDSNVAPQKIWYMNVVPKVMYTKVPVTMLPACAGPGVVCYVGRTKRGPMPYLENMDSLLEKLNKRLKEDPIPGKILTIESLDMKLPGFFEGGKLNPDDSYWFQKGTCSKSYLTVVRLFFVVGQPTVQEIAIKDIEPLCITKTTRTSLGTPQFEPYEKVIEKASKWIGQQKNIQVTNLQTVSAKLTKNMFEAKYEVNTRSMSHQSWGMECIYLRVLRVPYLILPPGAPPPYSLSLSNRTFVPVRFGRAGAETTSMTVHRLNCWLQAAGGRVIGVETVQELYEPDIRKPLNINKSSYKLVYSRGYHWITLLRVYLDGVVDEPPPDVFEPIPAFRQTQSSCCTIQ